jgi:hypothetical protein
MSHGMEKNQLIEQIVLYYKHVKEREQYANEIENYKKVKSKYPFDILPLIAKVVAYILYALVALIIYKNISSLDIFGRLAEMTLVKFDNQIGEMISKALTSSILKWIFIFIYIWIMYNISTLLDGVFNGAYKLTQKYIKEHKKVYLKQMSLNNVKANQQVIQELVRRMKEKELILKESRLIPMTYMHQDSLSKFRVYLESGRADSLKECIEIYETENRHRQLMEELRSIKELLKFEE